MALRPSRTCTDDIHETDVIVSQYTNNFNNGIRTPLTFSGVAKVFVLSKPSK